jgi:hypothetical protein
MYRIRRTFGLVVAGGGVGAFAQRHEARAAHDAAERLQVRVRKRLRDAGELVDADGELRGGVGIHRVAAAVAAGGEDGAKRNDNPARGDRAKQGHRGRLSGEEWRVLSANETDDGEEFGRSAR